MLLLVLHPESSTDMKTYANLLKIPYHRLGVSGLCFKFLDLIHKPTNEIHFMNNDDYLEGAKNFRHFQVVHRPTDSINAITPLLNYVLYINSDVFSIYCIRPYHANI